MSEQAKCDDCAHPFHKPGPCLVWVKSYAGRCPCPVTESALAKQERADREPHPIDRNTVGPARATDPATSHEAGLKAARFSGGQRRLVYDTYVPAGERGLTHEELCDFFPNSGSGSGPRTRSNELVKLGYLRDTGMRRKTRNGDDAIVWAVTDQIPPPGKIAKPRDPTLVVEGDEVPR